MFLTKHSIAVDAKNSISTSGNRAPAGARGERREDESVSFQEAAMTRHCLQAPYERLSPDDRFAPAAGSIIVFSANALALPQRSCAFLEMRPARCRPAEKIRE